LMLVPDKEAQAIIWDYFKPRHTHAWNMLVLSWRQLDAVSPETEIGFDTEYHWENFILRLWLYRTTVRTLTKLSAVKAKAEIAIKLFDDKFRKDGKNQLKALRDMIEHFDDYAAGDGRGPAERFNDLDPWRVAGGDQYQRGQFGLLRADSYSAAIKLKSEAEVVSAAFIQWYKSPVSGDKAPQTPAD
jgi:hypothetical protein